MDKERKIILQFYFIFFIVYAYFIGGSLQFFIGVSNTLITFFGVVSFLILYLSLSKLKIKKTEFDLLKITLILFVYTIIISFANNVNILKPLLYSLFFLVPLTTYFLIENGKDLSKKIHLKKLLLYVAIFQLPILLIQNYLYDSIIVLNNSSQQIAHVDFTFGSFFLKNDHSLGFFLVANILYIWSFPILKNTYQKYIVTIILIINLFISNSNTSILYFFGAVVFLVLQNKQSILNISIKKVIYLLSFFTLIYLLVDYLEPKFYLDLQNKLSNSLDYKTALKWYKEGNARREQIIVVLLKDGLNFFGNGAYTYFDILKGQFSGFFRHFSQLIWLYYDLGLVGISLFMVFIYKIHRLFKNRSTNFSLYLSLGLLLYSFFTIVTFDISFMLTYFIYRYNYAD